MREIESSPRATPVVLSEWEEQSGSFSLSLSSSPVDHSVAGQPSASERADGGVPSVVSCPVIQHGKMRPHPTANKPMLRMIGGKKVTAPLSPNHHPATACIALLDDRRRSFFSALSKQGDFDRLSTCAQEYAENKEIHRRNIFVRFGSDMRTFSRQLYKTIAFALARVLAR